MVDFTRETVVTFIGADGKSYSFNYNENDEKAFAKAFNKIMAFPDSVIGHLDIDDFFELVNVPKSERTDFAIAAIQKQAAELQTR